MITFTGHAWYHLKATKLLLQSELTQWQSGGDIQYTVLTTESEPSLIRRSSRLLIFMIYEF